MERGKPITYIRCEKLEPARWTVILACILKAERHPFLIHLPSRNSVPLKFNNLRFQSAVLLRRVKLKCRRAYGGYHVTFLSRIACAVREHDIAITAQFPRQF